VSAGAPPRDGGLRYAYVHGFASGPRSKKGNAFAAALRGAGAEVHLPDLNVPSFERLTCSGMLAGLDALDAGVAADGRGWGLIGSSLGGWAATRWAELHPDRVARLVLLAPGLDLATRWRALLDDERLARWQREEWIDAVDGDRQPSRLHWGFMTDARAQPGWPRPPCPTLVLHGDADSVVPLAVSEELVRRYPEVTLEVVADDHDLLCTLPHLLARTLEWFGLAAAGRAVATPG
jgi:pimeloyl-ACP methyl ester carboxylesterase